LFKKLDLAYFPPRRRTLRLGGFAACPAELRGAKYFFFSRKAPKKSWSLGLPTGGLGGLAALRAILFSFFLAKTERRKEIMVH
jgi:hypothetical protein